MRISNINDIAYPRRKPTPMPPFRGYGCNSRVFGSVPIVPMAMGIAGSSLLTCMLIRYLIRMEGRNDI